MGDYIEIDPNETRSAAVQFDRVADTTRVILDNLVNSTSSKGEPWGDDKAGNEFAEGEKGYKVNRDNTFDTLGQLVTIFQDNATNLRDTATSFENNERQG